jgi:2-polyprenyl-3-methyl-5-hydroxy-6-metoxy-1,4-benzoquinol methylase
VSSLAYREVFHHRTKYFLCPQHDIYKNVARKFLRDQGRVLDYGCGNGTGTMTLVGGSRVVHGVDSDAAAVGLAKDLFGHLASFETGDWMVDDLPRAMFPVVGDTLVGFDLIVCVEVVEHLLGDPNVLLERFRDVLAPGGSIVLSTLNHNGDFRKNDAHVGRYDARSFHALLKGWFRGVELFDWTLENRIDQDSTRTPMVAVWTDGGR